jgi:hypothetical protein
MFRGSNARNHQTACCWLCVQSSALPPHAVAVDSALDGILLAVSPQAGGEPADGAVAGPSTNGGPLPNGQQKPMEEDDEPVSPRTLKEAVARLAQYTSDHPLIGGSPYLPAPALPQGTATCHLSPKP